MFDLLRKSYNWTDCLTHGCCMFQRKSLSSFHRSSNTSLCFYCHHLLFIPLYPPCHCPFIRTHLLCLHAIFVFLLFSLSSHSFLSSFLHLRFHLCSLPICMSVFWLCGRHPVKTCCVYTHVCIIVPLLSVLTEDVSFVCCVILNYLD